MFLESLRIISSEFFDAFVIPLPCLMKQLLSEKQEEARQVLRRWREQAWREIQDGFKTGAIREDDKFRAKDDLQELIEEYSKKIDDLGEKKKREIAS